jgi:arylsulfatase A-like enzyme
MGGIAVRAYGIPRPTYDLDFTLALPRERLHELYLSAEGDSIDSELLGHIVSCVRCLDEVNRFAFVGNDVAVDDRVLRDLEDVYDAEVLSLDTELRRLFQGLASRGLLENAIVVITSDHGEEFKEHGLIGHEKTLYGEVIRVPFLIALPGGSTRTEIAETVSLVDLAPTLLRLAGISADALEGIDLVPACRGARIPKRTIEDAPGRYAKLRVASRKSS